MPRERDIALDCSPFLDRLAQSHPDWLPGLRQEGRLETDSPPAPAVLDEQVEACGLDPGLRRFRNREMMRIIWRELNGRADLEQTMADLTRLAELCLQAAIVHHAEVLRSRFGQPRDAAGAAVDLVVLGLGKLGGGELNLSSDIDIVFTYPEGGETDGTRSLANEQYFLRLARAVVGSLGEVTADGFCFRVDTRLRPFGESGPLVCSFGAMEQYYQREGRDWERYALIKARPVAGDLGAGASLVRALRPFVYRRYIDFGAVEALRDMLESVRADAARKGREDDIKRGPGGIREIEFLVQCLQLLRGGREPALQTNSLLEALDRLEELALFPAEHVARLRGDYVFLRRLENAIQALHDQQTHRIPSGQDLERVSQALGHTGPGPLLDRVEAARARVTAALDEYFPRPQAAPADVDWRDTRETAPAGPGQPLEDFKARLARTALSQRASMRLDQFMPMLLERMRAADMPGDVQRDVLELVYTICRRSAYLSLLVQNPLALDRMLELFAASSWIAATVIRYPALLDELIDPSLGQWLPEREDLRDTIARMLRGFGDTESAIQALNYMKRAQSLRVAVAELESRLDSGQAQARLTVLAEVLIEACLGVATRIVREKHGSMAGPGLAVIAYGTLGAGDMSYGSDLDLVFLYQAAESASDGARPLMAEQYYTRLTRRMLSLATTVSAAGRLYEIDTRLRPNGRAGLLVSSLSAFERYQSGSAWIWELQALVRARPVAGDRTVAARFEEIRSAVLGQPRDSDELRREVREMRQRMREGLPAGDPFKHAEGALVDIDFIAQLGVLECAHSEPRLLRHTSTRKLLAKLAECGWLSRTDATVLAKTHAALTRARQLEALARTGSGAGSKPETAASWSICSKFLASEAPAPQLELE